MRRFMRVFGEVITEALKDSNIGFCLLLFPKEGESGIANYISDCDREDMIRFLRATANRLEKNKDKT